MIEKNMENEVSDDEDVDLKKENIDKNILSKGQYGIKNFTIKLEKMNFSKRTLTTHLGKKRLFKYALKNKETCLKRSAKS